MSELAPGIVKELNVTVGPEMTARHLGSGSAAVLATPHMIALMEGAAQQSVAPYLADGQSTVGVHVDVRHLAATPLGMQVRVRAELMAVDGRKLTFKVEAFDASEKIGEGVHERFVIDLARFEDRLKRKRDGTLKA
jgi:fluoroacetyl-CoA thioesterase